RESKSTLDFKLGVVLSGMLENKSGEWATFEIDSTLLTTVSGATKFTLMPSDWYLFNISENKIMIPKGKMLGDFTISIDKAKFLADSSSLNATYALPVRLTASSADSLLVGTKDYTIIVIKYISEKSGTYYVRGKQVQINDNGEEIGGSLNEYFKTDWSQNTTRNLTTLSSNNCKMKGIGTEVSDEMILTFDSNNSVELSAASTGVTEFTGNYDNGVYNLKYKYIKGGKTYRVNEYLKQRNDPENDLRYEEW
ncbi:MAG: DUF1735 domain-containing protein, partial [Dysgonomonas sp.]